jgi:acetate kinase
MESVNGEIRLGDGTGLGIGHRVVHGGETFQEPALIDDEVMRNPRAHSLAPLHNPKIYWIEVARERFPVSCRLPSSTRRFTRLPPRAYQYALPNEFYEKHRVRKYGFHGSSHE